VYAKLSHVKWQSVTQGQWSQHVWCDIVIPGWSPLCRLGIKHYCGHWILWTMFLVIWSRKSAIS